MANSFQAILYASLKFDTLGGNVTVTGISQKASRRQLLSSTLTMAFTVRSNNPAVTTSTVSLTLGDPMTVSAVGSSMALAAGSTVTATVPVITVVTPTPTTLPSAEPTFAVTTKVSQSVSQSLNWYIEL